MFETTITVYCFWFSSILCQCVDILSYASILVYPLSIVLSNFSYHKGKWAIFIGSITSQCFRFCVVSHSIIKTKQKSYVFPPQQRIHSHMYLHSLSSIYFIMYLIFNIYICLHFINNGFCILSIFFGFVIAWVKNLTNALTYRWIFNSNEITVHFIFVHDDIVVVLLLFLIFLYLRIVIECLQYEDAKRRAIGQFVEHSIAPIGFQFD